MGDAEGGNIRQNRARGGFQQEGLRQAVRLGYIRQDDAQQISQQLNRITNSLQQNVANITITTLNNQFHNQNCQCEGCAGTRGCCGSFNKQEILAYINATNQNPQIFFSQNPKDLEIKQELLKKEREKIYRQIEQQMQNTEKEVVINFLGLKSENLTKNKENENKKQHKTIVSEKYFENESKHREINNNNEVKIAFSTLTHLDEKLLNNTKIENLNRKLKLENSEEIYIPQLIRQEKNFLKKVKKTNETEKKEKIKLSQIIQTKNSNQQALNSLTQRKEKINIEKIHHNMVKLIKEIRNILKTQEINSKLKDKVERILLKIEKLSNKIENKNLQQIIKTTIEKLREELKKKLENIKKEQQKQKANLEDKTNKKTESLNQRQKKKAGFNLDEEEIKKIKQILKKILKEREDLNKILEKKLRNRTILKLLLLQYYTTKKEKKKTKLLKILEKLLKKVEE